MIGLNHMDKKQCKHRDVLAKLYPLFFMRQLAAESLVICCCYLQALVGTAYSVHNHQLSSWYRIFSASQQLSSCAHIQYITINYLVVHIF